MYTITEKNSPLGDGNKVLGEFPRLENSKITFDGAGNVLYCEPGVRLKNSTIEFRGDNSLVYLSESRHLYFLNMVIYHQSNCFFGKHNYMNGPLKAILSERKNIVVGEEGQFSFGIWMRLADPHLIYDVETRKRINPSRSIYIGDHVWIGQGATLLRGTRVGSGSIIGAMSVVSGGSSPPGGTGVPSNTSWAGCPVKMVRPNIFWRKECVHAFREEDTEKWEQTDGEEYIFGSVPATTPLFDEIESRLDKGGPVEERVLYFQDVFRTSNIRSRFFIPLPEPPTKKQRRLFAALGRRQ